MSSTIKKDVFIMAFPHLDWSCEAIEYRVKTCPVPEQLEKRNHLFVIIEDRLGIQTEEKSIDIIGKQVLARFPHLPAFRMHLLLHKSDRTCDHGMKIFCYDFYKNKEKKVSLATPAKDVSSLSSFASLCTF